jgi:pimeloyl-ACP methyl ester carboxylesterase
MDNPREAQLREEEGKTEMNPVTELTTNPNADIGSGSVNGGAATATASPKPTTTTGVVFGASPGMPGIFKSNFDYQLVRGMLAGAYGEGGAFGELYSTARRVVDRDIESWTAEWSGTAERVETIAVDCLSGGHVVSAREAFLRASLYWRTGLFFLDNNDPRQLPMYKRHRACFRQAAALFDPQIEPIDIPYENGKTLPGYLMRADATGRPRATVMILGGGDTTCEELYDFGGGAAAVRRGYNAFLWEGPGQVGAYATDRELTYRPDYEVPTRYAVDYVLSREDVDPKRLALSGHSMGGYFAPRAAAYEKRITAVIANSLAPDCKPVLLAMMGLDPNASYGEDIEDKIDRSEPMKKFMTTNFKERCGMAGKSLVALFDDFGSYTLAGLERKITCPLLSIAGEGEGPLMMGLGHAFYEKLTCPKTERVVRALEGGEAHCTMNNPSLKHQIEFDWLDEVFK